MIPLEKETPDMFEMTRVYEHCVLCDNQTNMWHTRTNTPCCTACAGKHTVKEMLSAKEIAYARPLEQD